MTTTLPVRNPADDLADRIAGQVITPEHPAYDDARLVWNRAYEHRPAVIVIPANAADVSAAVRHARASGLRIAIQSTGHGVAKRAFGSMLISMQNLTHVSIDPDAWTARIGGGATWHNVLGPAQDVGLAPLLGSAPDVGAVGYTLGGGMGWLARRFGLSVDHVRWLEVVTADGEIRRVCPDVDPDLFWALRGGGAGSLGVVTAMEVNLVPITSVYAGNLLYPAIDAAEVADRYRQWIADAPDELTSSLVLVNYPPLDDVPDPVRGLSFAIIRGCYSGDPDEGADLLRYWREWQVPLHDLWGHMSFRDVATISNDPVDPMPGMSSSEWLRHIDDDVMEILIRSLFPADGPPLLLATEIRHAGGAIARPPSDAAYGNRREQYLLQMVGVGTTPDELSMLDQHVQFVRSELAPHVRGSAYLNFLEGDEKLDRTEAGFEADAWPRLRAVKAAFDPANAFNHGLAL